jgi:hypothetical protein
MAMKSKSLLDLMTPEEREKALERGKKRQERRRTRKGLDISPEIFDVCEFGYYFGWEAVMAVRRGYTVAPGTNEKELLSKEEVQILLEGARKVWYTKLLETASTNMASTTSAFSNTPRESLEAQLKAVKKLAETKE